MGIIKKTEQNSLQIATPNLTNPDSRPKLQLPTPDLTKVSAVMMSFENRMGFIIKMPFDVRVRN